MKSINPNTKCGQAEPYYYDYLSNFKGDIPNDVSQHINKCSFCQNEIHKLNIVMTKIEKNHNNTKQIDAAITTNLKLHFSFEGKMVKCQTVKPFLPSLADPLLKVRIPTPITVHIDNCHKCKETLQKIQSLNLSHRQLCILGQILAEPPPGKELCAKAQAVIPHLITLSLSKTSSECLKHLCICPDCRARLYRLRDSFCKSLSKTNIERANFPCESVLPTDIFDYCFPYGIDVENDQYANFRMAITSHIYVCATCLNRMQQLHKTISGVLEYTDSGIVTCYKINPEQKTHADNTNNIYKEWPIRVEVYDSSLQKTPENPTIPEQKSQKESNVIKLIKLLSAAAVILFFLALYFSPSAAKAFDLNRIYTALSKLQNVYFATYAPDKDVPYQEKWISGALNAILIKGESRIDLWDINKKVQKSIDLKSSNSLVTQSDLKDPDGITKTMLPPWGLLPFNDIGDAPKNSDAQWQKIDNRSSGVAIKNVKIYELEWQETVTSGALVSNKWRGYVDISTKLLRRVEFWQKREPAEQYELKVIRLIEYPSTAEVEQWIKKFGF